MSTKRRPLRWQSSLAIGLLAVFAGGATAQEQQTLPLSSFILAGYGTTTYDAALTDEFGNNFTASISPVLLFNVHPDVLFEAELEFGLSGELTTTTLEYAQIDYLGFEKVQIIAGKFLVPFGLFGERIHPTWVNKLPTSPLLFGHGHGGVAEGSLLPVLSDAGVMLRFNQPINRSWHFDLSGYVTQGPILAAEGDAGHEDSHDEAVALAAALDPVAGGESHFEVPQVGFGVGFNDNNKNKMVGARLGLVKGPSVEFYVSGFHAMYDPGNFLDFKGGAVSLEARRGSWEFRTEAAMLWQEFEHEEGVFETLESPGYYAQFSRRFGLFEPVVRWSQLMDAKVDGELSRPGREDFTAGLNYWISESIPLKIAYVVDPDRDDRMLVQWAFGF